MTAKTAPANAAAPITAAVFLLRFFFTALQISMAQTTQTAATASAGLVSSADRAYMKAPVPRPTPDFGTKCPELVDTLTKKQTDFSLKIGMGGEAILGLCYLPDK